MWIKKAKIYYKIVMRSVLEFRYYYYDPERKRYIFLGQWFCMRYDRRGYKKMTPKILYKKLGSHNYIPSAEPIDLKEFFIGNILT